MAKTARGEVEEAAMAAARVAGAVEVGVPVVGGRGAGSAGVEEEAVTAHAVGSGMGGEVAKDGGEGGGVGGVDRAMAVSRPTGSVVGPSALSGDHDDRVSLWPKREGVPAAAGGVGAAREDALGELRRVAEEAGLLGRWEREGVGVGSDGGSGGDGGGGEGRLVRA